MLFDFECRLSELSINDTLYFLCLYIHLHTGCFFFIVILGRVFENFGKSFSQHATIEIQEFLVPNCFSGFDIKESGST